MAGFLQVRARGNVSVYRLSSFHEDEEYIVQFQVKVRVDISKMVEFGYKLQKGELDRSCIRGETHCLSNDPAVGFSIWEANSRSEFNAKFDPWRHYYSEVEINEVITPMEAMGVLFAQMR